MKISSKTNTTVKKILENYNFPEFQWVYCRPTLAGLFKPNNCCGIYVFRSQNEEYYVGQAVDVVRRYLQHKTIHNDIQEITFKTYPLNNLDSIEKKLIGIFEINNIKLRNISLTSIPKGDTDLDLIISKEEQENWLATNKPFPLQEHFIDNPNLREKYARKYNKLILRDDFNKSGYPFLKHYFSKCVLQPAKTELSFWAISCLTNAFTNSNLVSISRLNLYWCEVLTIWVDKEKVVHYNFHLTKSLLSKSYLNSLKIKSLEIDDQFYERGGADQFNIEVQGIKDALRLLADEMVVRSIKTFNFRQMQKGATVFNRYHCIDLARLILTNVEHLPKRSRKENVISI